MDCAGNLPFKISAIAIALVRLGEAVQNPFLEGAYETTVIADQGQGRNSFFGDGGQARVEIDPGSQVLVEPICQDELIVLARRAISDVPTAGIAVITLLLPYVALPSVVRRASEPLVILAAGVAGVALS